MNLRGLGGNRSLVLFDGHRVQPINGQLLVDINTIPSAAIDRVEVITGGAAAVYGADAIAGVVNFIPKKDFTGVEINAQSGISAEGDGQETSISGIMGATFADGRGSVMMGADYSKRDIIYGRDRAWVVRGWNDPGTTGGGIGSSNLSQYDPARAQFCGVTNCGQPLAPPFGTGNNPAAGFPLLGSTYVIDQNGHVFDASDPTNAAHPYTGPLGGDSGFKINPSQAPGQPGALAYNDAQHSYLQLPLERYAIFGSGHINLTDKIDVYSELHYSQTYASASGFVSNVFNVWSPTVPYNHSVRRSEFPDFRSGAGRLRAPPGARRSRHAAELARRSGRALDLRRRPGLLPEFHDPDHEQRLSGHRRREGRPDGRQARLELGDSCVARRHHGECAPAGRIPLPAAAAESVQCRYVRSGLRRRAACPAPCRWP